MKMNNEIVWCLELTCSGTRGVWSKGVIVDGMWLSDGEAQFLVSVRDFGTNNSH